MAATAVLGVSGELHVALDEPVAGAYGWGDLALEHGYHGTTQGVRFTISEAGQVEVLDRLLEWNHERYRVEVAAGLHEKGRVKVGRQADTRQVAMFGDAQ